MNAHGALSPSALPLPPSLATKTATSTVATSYMNRVLSSMTLIALGAMGGFGIFHSVLHYRIEQTELTHNATLAIVTNRCFESEQERNRCLEIDDGRLQELSDLRGRLDAQHKSWYDLTAAQRSMVSKQKDTTAQMQRFREVYETDQQALASLKAASEQKDRDLITVQEDYRRTKSELTKLQEAKEGETLELQVQMKHKGFELESLLENLNRLSDKMEQLQRERDDLQTRIQQQDEELESTKKNSDTLQNQKRSLEDDVLDMRDQMYKMESRIRQQDEELKTFKKQVVEKDNELLETDRELSEYREQEEELETKIVNFREGMLGLLREKMHEIQDLETRVELFNKEKAELETRLDNWREGMLDLLKEKTQEIDQLKAALAESRESMKTMMEGIEMARLEHVEAELFVEERLKVIDQNSDSDAPERKKMIQELLQEIERVRENLRESQEWIVKATEKIEDHKSDQAESEELISDKMNEINNLKQHIEINQKSADEEISKLASDLAEARKAVQEKTTQIEHLKRLNSDLHEIVMDVNDLKSNDILLGSTTSEKMMIDHVQQRDGVMCRQLFGKGSYYVKFVVRLPPGDGEDNNNTIFFVIELSSRKELPHSTYTFLTLVESNLYNDGVSFLSAGDDGSSLKIESSHSTDGVRLEQKLKPLGLTGGSSLSFVEPTTSGEALPCSEYSFGFVHRGPELNLFLSSDNETTDCFAHVIRGQEDLKKIKSILLENRQPLEIISAKHLRVD